MPPASNRPLRFPIRTLLALFPSRSTFIRCGVLSLLLLGGEGVCFGSFSLTFQGLTRTLTAGSLSSPAGVVVDAAGNVYVADTGNNRIVVVNPQGTASVLSITGLSPALSSPMGIALDGSANLYVADVGNNRVVKISPAGAGAVISTGGVTLSAPQGVAIDQSGNLFIADTGNNRTVELAAGGSAVVLGVTGVVPTTPVGLAVDNKGNLYIADSVDNRIVTVAAGGAVGMALTISGGVVISGPTAVAVDSIGNVYIADTGNNRIAEVDIGGVGSVLYTLSPMPLSPRAVALDVFGAVYVADTGNNQVLASYPPVNADVVAGSPTYSLNKTAVGFGHLPMGFSVPTTLTLPFTIADTTLGSVQVFTFGTPNLDFFIGSSNTCTSGLSTAGCSVDVEFLPTAPGLRNGAIVLYDSATPPNPILTIPLYGFCDAPVAALSPNNATVIGTGAVVTDFPYQLALDGAGNMYLGNYVQTPGHPKVVKVPAGGGSASAVSTAPVTLGTSITGIALDGAGNVFIADYYNDRIVVVTPAGLASVLSITGLSSALGQPTELAFDGAGNLYIADYAANGRAFSRAVEVSSLSVLGSTSSGLGRVVGTGSFTFSSSSMTGLGVGPNGTVYIAARTSNASHVIQVTASGVASQLVPSGLTLSDPQGAFVDGMGNLYVEDAGNNRIVEITSAGVASAVAIQGLSAPTTISSGYGMATDASGNVYIPDWTNSRIVYLSVAGASLSFNSTKVGLTSTDSPKTATLTNLGNQDLILGANPTYTANFSQPSGAVNPCMAGTTLTGGTVCKVAVQFTPQTVATLSANITVADNTLNAGDSVPQQIAVGGTGLTPGDTTATAVVSNPAAAKIGQPITITATVTDTATGHSATIPTGGVTFMDTVGSTSVSLNGGAAVALSGGVAVLAGATLSGAGAHTITANYAGVSGSFLGSGNTASVTVTKDTETIAGPVSQPVQVSVGQVGSLGVTVTGLYGVVPVPSGSLSYTILDSSNATVASGTASLTAGSGSSSATVPVANTLAAGTYTVSVSYAGDTNYAASAAAVVIQVLVGQITPALTWAQPSTIPYGSTLAGSLTAMAANGSTPVPGTFAYTATLQGGSPAAVTAATVLGAGAYTLSVTFTPTDTTTYKSTTASVALTVDKAAPSAVALASTATTVLMKAVVTFTATVSAAAGAPTGTVSFYDGTTLAGTGTLAQGVATLATSTLTVGAHTITAAYGGDSNFSALTSSAVTETVQDFTLNVTAGGATSATVLPGGTATYPLVIGPSTGTTFPAAVALTLSGLPSGATGTLTPSTLPSGAGSTNVTLTVQLPQTTATLQRRELVALGLAPWMLGMFLFPFGRPSRRWNARLLVLAGIVLLGGLLGLTGCGSRNTGFFGNPPQNYPITVTGTSGALSHSTTVTLIVQ